jgi:hypothetical protein
MVSTNVSQICETLDLISYCVRGMIPTADVVSQFTNVEVILLGIISILTTVWLEVRFFIGEQSAIRQMDMFFIIHDNFNSSDFVIMCQSESSVH